MKYEPQTALESSFGVLGQVVIDDQLDTLRVPFEERGNDGEDHQPQCPLHDGAGLGFHSVILGFTNGIVKRVAEPGIAAKLNLTMNAACIH